MNYIRIINHFQDTAHQLDGFNGSHLAVFMSVVHHINRNGWRDKTRIDLSELLCRSGVSKPTYLKARGWLATHGWIGFLPGRNGATMAEFSLGSQFDQPSEAIPEVKPEGNIFTPQTNPLITEVKLEDKILTSEPQPTLPEDNPEVKPEVNIFTSYLSSSLPIIIKQENNKQKTKEEEEEVAAATSENDVPIFVLKNRQSLTTHPEAATPQKVAPKSSPPGLDYYHPILAASATLIESACMTNNITAAECKQDLNAFIIEKKGEGHIPRDKQDIRRHFLSWMRIKYEVKKSNLNHQNGKFTKRTAGTLRPTSRTDSEYEGTGSTCNVAL